MNSESASPVNRTSVPQQAVSTRGLTREMYLSEDVFARETEVLTSQSWLYAGHVSQLASVGDYFLREVGRESSSWYVPTRTASARSSMSVGTADRACVTTTPGMCDVLSAPTTSGAMRWMDVCGAPPGCRKTECHSVTCH